MEWGGVEIIDQRETAKAVAYFHDTLDSSEWIDQEQMKYHIKTLTQGSESSGIITKMEL